MHFACLAFSLAWDSAGKSIAARMAMMAMTTKSSINVKACREEVERGEEAANLLLVVE